MARLTSIGLRLQLPSPESAWLRAFSPWCSARPR